MEIAKKEKEDREAAEKAAKKQSIEAVEAARTEWRAAREVEREAEQAQLADAEAARDARELDLVSNGRDESCGSRHGRRLGRRGMTTRMGLLVLFHHVKGERVCAFGLPFGSVRYSGD